MSRRGSDDSAVQGGRRWLRAVGSVSGNTIGANAAMVLVAVITARQVGPTGRGIIVVFTTVASFTMLLSSLGANVRARVDLTQRRGLGLPEYLGLAASVIGYAALALGMARAVAPGRAGGIDGPADPATHALGDATSSRVPC